MSGRDLDSNRPPAPLAPPVQGAMALCVRYTTPGTRPDQKVCPGVYLPVLLVAMLLPISVSKEGAGARGERQG